MRLFSILLLAGCCSLSLPAQAADISAYTEEMPPLNYQNGPRVGGFATELLQLVMRQAGCGVDSQG